MVVKLENNFLKYGIVRNHYTNLCRVFLFTLLHTLSVSSQLPPDIQKLVSSYPAFIQGYEDNQIIFKDGTTLMYDDGKSKTIAERLKSPDIKDLFAYTYPKGKLETVPAKNEDPGRIRNEKFLQKMYGKTTAEVQKNLTVITWCPKLLGQKLSVTTANNVHLLLQQVSAELDDHPEWKKYLQSAGAFNWRLIRGTKQLSTHSFGIAIDLNTAYSDYWQWDCRCTDENARLTYTNRIPQGIVDIFEKYGFIWGGKWYHYDTMHFEYRPELL